MKELILPIPVFYKDKSIYYKLSYKQPKTRVLAATHEIAESQGVYPAMLEFAAGSIVSATSIEDDVVEDKTLLRAIVRKMSFQSVEAISLMIMSLVNPDDYIEGVYKCPKCGKKVITGDDLGSEEKNRVSDLKINRMGENEEGKLDYTLYDNSIYIDLEEPVVIKDQRTGNNIQEINNMEFTYPNMDDCIKGSQKYPVEKSMMRDLAITANALKRVNGKDVDIKYKKTWGEYILSETCVSDMTKISESIDRFGLKKSILRTCRICGKKWDAPVNTSNFFVSGLQ